MTDRGSERVSPHGDFGVTAAAKKIAAVDHRPTASPTRAAASPAGQQRKNRVRFQSKKTSGS